MNGLHAPCFHRNPCPTAQAIPVKAKITTRHALSKTLNWFLFWGIKFQLLTITRLTPPPWPVQPHLLTRATLRLHCRTMVPLPCPPTLAFSVLTLPPLFPKLSPKDFQDSLWTSFIFNKYLSKAPSVSETVLMAEVVAESPCSHTEFIWGLEVGAGCAERKAEQSGQRVCVMAPAGSPGCFYAPAPDRVRSSPSVLFAWGTELAGLPHSSVIPGGQRLSSRHSYCPAHNHSKERCQQCSGWREKAT